MTPALVACVLLAALPAVFAYAIPVAWWAARARGAPAGVSLRDRAVLDIGAQVDTMLLDRWGTVTTGQLRVVSVEPVEPDHERSLRWFAGALGHAADDPVGRAIARLSSRGRLSQVEHHVGHGISGCVDRHPVRLGRPEWLGMDPRDEAGLTVGVQVDARPIGYVTVADDVRPHARADVERLRAMGTTPVLVSEDTERNTRALTEACGITEWYADRPAGTRAGLVDELRLRGRVVAVASTTPIPRADLVLTDAADDTAGIRLADLDIDRVVTALTLVTRAARGRTRARRTGVALAVLGVALAVVLPHLAAVVCAILACGITATAAVLDLATGKLQVPA